MSIFAIIKEIADWLFIGFLFLLADFFFFLDGIGKPKDRNKRNRR